MNFTFDNRVHLRSSWNATRMLVRGKLTDRKIAQYEKSGWYSEAFKEARRDLMARKQAKRAKRDGNFTVSEGRMIYNPL